ncbi:hypothetical protein HAX54_005490 [Datura stramonium]|uniref:Uncharacterized protein n=1 Tax=Datura stramonium TaxID=4076 RepID=A0ABS8WVX3_DATST|nr:hypothetical protein [Datura stramonium]
MAGFGREENDRGEGGAAAGAVVVVAREMKKKEGKKGVKRLPAMICHRKIWGEEGVGGCMLFFRRWRRRGEEVEREVTGWVCCRKLWRYGCGLLYGGGRRTCRHGGFARSYEGYSVLRLGGSGVRRRGCWSQGRKGFPAKQWPDLVVGEERERGSGKEGCDS